jgi:hypothetical protein
MNLGVLHNFQSFGWWVLKKDVLHGANYQVMRVSALKKKRRNTLHWWEVLSNTTNLFTLTDSSLQLVIKNGLHYCPLHSADFLSVNLCVYIYIYTLEENMEAGTRFKEWNKSLLQKAYVYYWIKYNVIYSQQSFSTTPYPQAMRECYKELYVRILSSKRNLPIVFSAPLLGCRRFSFLLCVHACKYHLYPHFNFALL